MTRALSGLLAILEPSRKTPPEQEKELRKWERQGELLADEEKPKADPRDLLPPGPKVVLESTPREKLPPPPEAPPPGKVHHWQEGSVPDPSPEELAQLEREDADPEMAEYFREANEWLELQDHQYRTDPKHPEREARARQLDHKMKQEYFAGKAKHRAEMDRLEAEQQKRQRRPSSGTGSSSRPD